MTPEQQQAVEKVQTGLGGDFSFAGIGPSEDKEREALAALDFLVSELEAAEEGLAVEKRRAEAAAKLRDEYAQQWDEVFGALHDYWFAQESMTAGQAVTKLLAERKAAEARVRELEDAALLQGMRIHRHVP